MPNQWRKSPFVVRLKSKRLSAGPSKAERQAYYGRLSIDSNFILADGSYLMTSDGKLFNVQVAE